MDRLAQLEDADQQIFCLMDCVLRGLDRALGFGMGGTHASRAVCGRCADSVDEACGDARALACNQAWDETGVP